MLTQHMSNMEVNKSGRQALYVGSPLRHVYQKSATVCPAFCAQLGSAMLRLKVFTWYHVDLQNPIEQLVQAHLVVIHRRPTAPLSRLVVLTG